MEEESGLSGVRRRTASGWDGIVPTTYKNEPGTWVDVARHVLFDSPDSQFQVRYFEIAPNGYSSFEMHEHEHCVVVIRGSGKVRLGDSWQDIHEGDLVRVLSSTPHQFRSEGETLGILCVVDADRDAPRLLGNSEPPISS